MALRISDPLLDEFEDERREHFDHFTVLTRYTEMTLDLMIWAYCEANLKAHLLGRCDVTISWIGPQFTDGIRCTYPRGHPGVMHAHYDDGHLLAEGSARPSPKANEMRDEVLSIVGRGYMPGALVADVNPQSPFGTIVIGLRAHLIAMKDEISRCDRYAGNGLYHLIEAEWPENQEDSEW